MTRLQPLSFLSCVSWAERIYLPTKHTKRGENFKDEDRLGVRTGGRSNPVAWIPPLPVRRLEHPCNPWLLGPLRGGEADYLLFALDGECALCRRQKSFLHVFPGAGSKIAAATQVELALNIFAMALNRFYTEMK